MPKAKDVTDATRPATRETEKEGGSRIPSVATAYQVVRTTGTGKEYCSIHAAGQKVEIYPLDKFPPNKEEVKKIWGSGRYRFAWRRPDGGACGTSAVFEWDDPEYPRRPSYAEPPRAPATSPANPAPAAPRSVAMPAVGADGRVAVNEIMQLLVFNEELARRRDEEDSRRRQRERDDEDRRLTRERDEHERRMTQRDREAQQTIARMNAAWASTIQGIQAAREQPSDSRVAEALERLAEREEEAEEGAAAGGADSSTKMLQSLVELLAPKIVDRLMSTPVAAAAATLPASSSEVAK